MYSGQVEPLEAEGELPGGGDLLVTLPWGRGLGEVGLADTTEGLSRGPEALAVAPDGRIAILDSVSGRLLLLDPSGKPFLSIPVPLDAPRFLAVDDNRLHVLDCDSKRQMITFAWNGETLGVIDLPESSEVVTGIFATDQGPCVELSHDAVLLLSEESIKAEGIDATGSLGGYPELVAQASRESSDPDPAAQQSRSAQTKILALAGRPTGRSLARLAQVTFQRGVNVRIRSFELDADTLEPVRMRESRPSIAGDLEIDHLVSVDGDGASGLIVGARLLEPVAEQTRKGSLVLTRLVPARSEDPNPGLTTPSAEQSPSRSLAGALETTESLYLPDNSSIYLGQPYVVAPDGRILQPWATEAGYSILVYSFAQLEEVRS